MLSSRYKKDKEITLNNIENLYEETEKSKVLLNEVLKYQITNNTSIYIVKGELITNKTFKKSNFKTGLIINTESLAFSVLPWEYIEKMKLDNIKIGDKLTISEDIYNIEKNAHNTFQYKNSTNEDIVQEYFNIYKFNALYNKEVAYNKLNKEYSNAKFSNLEEFQKYLNNNIIEISSGKAEEYQIKENEDYNQYVCKDSNGRYYIFRAKSVLDYNVILDTYTIDIPEFIAKYDQSNQQEKAILNLNKFMQALNDKDYKYAYSILAESFKQKNFKTQSEFEAYAKANFFDKNEFTYEKFGSEANTYYTYQIKVKDKTKAQNKEITKTFIILLEERKRLPVII